MKEFPFKNFESWQHYSIYFINRYVFAHHMFTYVLELNSSAVCTIFFFCAGIFAFKPITLFLQQNLKPNICIIYKNIFCIIQIGCVVAFFSSSSRSSTYGFFKYQLSISYFISLFLLPTLIFFIEIKTTKRLSFF